MFVARQCSSSRIAGAFPCCFRFFSPVELPHNFFSLSLLLLYLLLFGSGGGRFHVKAMTMMMIVMIRDEKIVKKTSRVNITREKV